MIPGQIRPLALGIFWRDKQILVFEGHAPLTQEAYYRPLGGAIEFGEYGPQALAREIREELGAEVKDLQYLGLRENIFDYAGEMGHEIVLVYEGQLADRKIYERDRLTAHEDDGSPIEVVWKSIEFFRRGEAPLYPNGLLELLLEQPERSVKTTS
jgi:8-oxo-dGTP pyrophosphatase MutT (NUDIX family)